MSCSFTEKISSLIDGELAAAEAREVERHVLSCNECERLKADFLSLRSQIAAFDTSLQPVVQNRALKKILTRGDRVVPARSMHWGWSMPAVAFATLLIAGAIVGLILYQSWTPNQRDSQQSVAVQSPSPVPSPEAATPEPEQPLADKDKEVKEEKETNAPRRTSPAPVKKPLQREPKPGEQFAVAPAPESAPEGIAPAADSEPVRSADTETLTAIHFEKSENLLRAFRNVRLNTRGTAADVAYERKLAQQLVYQNMILRREADAAGDVHIKSLLENLEPILLDIANLPDKPDSNAVNTIRDRVERKNIVALLQVNCAALARALD